MRNKTFSQTLTRLMLEKQISVRRLSEAAGLSPATIQRLKTGSTLPRSVTLDALAKGLDVPREQLAQAVFSDSTFSLFTPSQSPEKAEQQNNSKGTVPLLDFEELFEFLLHGTVPEDGRGVEWPFPGSDVSCVTPCWTDAMRPQVCSGDLLALSTTRKPQSNDVAVGSWIDSLYIGKFTLQSRDKPLLLPLSPTIAGTDTQKVDYVLAVVVGFFRKL